MPKTSAPLERKIPRYVQVASELREAILAGTFAGSKPFPTETALCREYDVSRFTVREALKRLQSEGLIARRRGSGTTVQPAAARGGALHQPLSNVGELLQYARDSQIAYEERNNSRLPKSLAAQIEGETIGEWRHFQGIRAPASDALPIAMTDVYFHQRLGDAVDQLDLAAGTLFSQIEQLCGVTIGRVTQDIQAIGATKEIANALAVKKGAPVLQIIRCYLDSAGAIYEISVSHHPGDRFAYAMHIDLNM